MTLPTGPQPGAELTVKRREQFHYALFTFGSALYLYPFLRVLWRVGDEGTLVYGAQRVAEGAVPYRDFLEVMGPGSFYWLGLFFKLFGTTWTVSRLSLLITGVATTLIVYWLARRLRSGMEALPAFLTLAITIPLWPAVSHHWDSNLFGLLAFAAFVSWLDSSRPWQLIAAGVLAGVTTLFMQQKGVLLLLSFLLTICVLRWKESVVLSSVARLMAGYLIVVAALLLYFFAAGALRQFVYANVVWPASNYQVVNSMPYGYGLREWYWEAWIGLLNPLLPAPLAYGAADFFLLPFLVITALPVLLAIFAATLRDKAFNRATLPYWLAGAALCAAEIHRPDVPHLIYGSPLFLILFVYLCMKRENRLWRYGVHALTLSIVLFAAFNALIPQAARTSVVTRRGTVRTFAGDAALDFLDRQTRPGDAVFIYPYYPMYYFLSGTTNPTRFSILVYQYNTDSQFREAISDLEQSKARFVLWDTVVDGPNLKRWFPAYRHPSEESLLMEPYLNEHYHLIDTKNGFRVLERKDATWAGETNPPARARSSETDVESEALVPSHDHRAVGQLASHAARPSKPWRGR